MRNWRIGWTKILPFLIVLCFLGIGIGPARSWINRQIGNLKTKATADYVPVPVDGAVKVPNALPEQPASFMVDSSPTTWWEAASPGAGQTVTINFKTSVNIDRIHFETGAEPFDSRARPKNLEIKTRSGHTNVTLGDSADGQNRDIQIHDVTSVTFKIIDVYPPADGGEDHVAIRTVSFFFLKR